MTAPRRPASFGVTPDKPAPGEPETRKAEAAKPLPRRPVAHRPDQVEIIPAPIDVFDAPDDDLAPPPELKPRGGSIVSSIFMAASGILVALALGLWTDQLLRALFDRSTWLGWFATGVAGVAALALLGIVVREFWALTRLGSIARLRQSATEALALDDAKAAAAVVRELSALMADRPETAAGRRAVADLETEIIDGANLVRLAETEILLPLDERAKTLILDAAKRVSVVTAVSPRALVDLVYVIFEASRLIRRIAQLYGGRPGTLGFFRLGRGVIAHLAVTGAIAAGDDFVHQIVGQGLAARLSARLGEGVVNGMMTARIGIAAMETVRPVPFSAVRRPGISDFLGALTTFSAAKGKAADR